MSGTYARNFSVRTEHTVALQNPDYLDSLLDQGFAWIRPMKRPWRASLREPTVGRIVEVFVTEYPGTVPILSRQGERLIWRLCGL